MSDDCYCGGRHPEWDYHTPTGCASTREKLAGAQATYAAMEADAR